MRRTATGGLRVWPIILLIGTALTCTEKPGITAPEVDPSASLLSLNLGASIIANAGGPYSGTAGTPITFRASAVLVPLDLVVTYTWYFGDGRTATGSTVTHTYSAAGTYTVTLRATALGGAVSDSDQTTATIVAANKPPVADAGGPYSGTAGVAVTFNGSGSSDPDGNTPLTYTWSFGDGSTGTGATPTHTYAAAGTYTVTLTVKDSKGKASAPDQTTATIAAQPPPNQAPVADAGGPYSGTAGTAVRFNGSGSTDPDGNVPLTYRWTFGDGTTGTGATPSHTYASAGTYTVTLTVTDAKGKASAPDNATATIAAQPPPNQAPVADAGGPYSGAAGTAVRFNGSGSSDPDGDLPLTYSWTFGDGSTGTGATPSHTYASAGTYTVTLTVTDAKGKASAPDNTTATITAQPPPNQAPVAEAGGPYSGTAGTAVRFNGSGSTDPDGDLPLTYSWSFGDGTTGTGATPSHSYASAGTYTVTLTVTDAKGKASAPDNTTATITAQPPPNQAPIAEAGGPYSGAAGTAIAFNGNGSSDPDGDLPLTYAWSFGDGTTATGATPTHTYATAGTYTATLTVTDAKGKASAPDNATVTVTSASPTVLMRDSFSRVVAEGWGDADVGGRWVVGMAGPIYRVDGSRGVIEVSSTGPQNVVGRDLATYGRDVTGLVSFSIDRAPDAASRWHTVQVYARRDDRVTDGDNYYRFRVRVLGTNAMDVRIEKNVNGVVSFVTDANAPTGATFTPGAKYWIRWEAFGTSPATTLRLRVWRDGTTEPTTWDASAVVDEPALDVSGTTGIRYQAPGDQVTWPVRLFIDDLRYSRR